MSKKVNKATPAQATTPAAKKEVRLILFTGKTNDAAKSTYAKYLALTTKLLRGAESIQFDGVNSTVKTTDTKMMNVSQIPMVLKAITNDVTQVSNDKKSFVLDCGAPLYPELKTDIKKEGVAIHFFTDIIIPVLPTNSSILDTIDVIEDFLDGEIGVSPEKIKIIYSQVEMNSKVRSDETPVDVIYADLIEFLLNNGITPPSKNAFVPNTELFDDLKTTNFDLDECIDVNFNFKDLIRETKPEKLAELAAKKQVGSKAALVLPFLNNVKKDLGFIS